MTTSLEVLNGCLRAVGERPVTDYNSLHPTALSARQTIQDVNRKFQGKGWWFNKEYNLVLQPQVGTGDIIVPSETLEVKPQGAYSYLVRRNNKLYDPVAHSYHISAAVTVTLTLLLPIEDLPSSAGDYLKELARYMWAVEEEVPEERINRYDRELLLAKTVLMNEQFNQLDLNTQHRPVSAFLKMHMQQYGGSGPSDPTYAGGE